MAKLRVIFLPDLETRTCYSRWFQELVVDGFLEWNLWILWMSIVHILEIQQSQMTDGDIDPLAVYEVHFVTGVSCAFSAP
jgi:hypothetical protein